MKNVLDFFLLKICVISNSHARCYDVCILVFAICIYLCNVILLILCICLQQVSEFDLFTLDDIDAAFQNVNRLTYSQNYHLSG